MNKTVEIYDTTLRDGTQQEGISLTVRDKLTICGLLDDLGVSYIEGGWPGANPKEDEFFDRVKTELVLDTAKLVAFGVGRIRSNAKARSQARRRLAGPEASRRRDGHRVPRGQDVGLSRGACSADHTQ